MMSGLTPREIVSELDRFIVGQQAAKRAVAIALWPTTPLPPVRFTTFTCVSSRSASAWSRARAWSSSTACCGAGRPIAFTIPPWDTTPHRDATPQPARRSTPE